MNTDVSVVLIGSGNIFLVAWRFGSRYWSFGVRSLAKTLILNKLRWFGCVLRIPADALLCYAMLSKTCIGWKMSHNYQSVE